VTDYTDQKNAINKNQSFCRFFLLKKWGLHPPHSPKMEQLKPHYLSDSITNMWIWQLMISDLPMLLVLIMKGIRIISLQLVLIHGIPYFKTGLWRLIIWQSCHFKFHPGASDHSSNVSMLPTLVRCSIWCLPWAFLAWVQISHVFWDFVHAQSRRGGRHDQTVGVEAWSGKKYLIVHLLNTVSRTLNPLLNFIMLHMTLPSPRYM
jgi:hypothetical protein